MVNKEDVQKYLDKMAFYTYWILGLLLVGGGSYYLYNRMNKQVAGVLVFMAGVIALYFYYVKWFLSPELQWPPVVTTCPDYLTFVGKYTNASAAANASSDSSVFCKDYVGTGAINKSNVGDAETNRISSYDSGQTAVTAGDALEIPLTKAGNIDPSICSTINDKGLTWISFCDVL